MIIIYDVIYSIANFSYLQFQMSEKIKTSETKTKKINKAIKITKSTETLNDKDIPHTKNDGSKS